VSWYGASVAPRRDDENFIDVMVNIDQTNGGWKA
jgi:hypothetical protein